MLGFLIGLIDPVSKITQAIVQARVETAKAATDQERIASEERIKALEARRDVIVAEAPLTRINAYLRASIGAWVSFLLGKILVWDKALGQWTGGKTDALSPELWQVVTIVLGFYFLSETAARIFKR